MSVEPDSGPTGTPSSPGSARFSSRQTSSPFSSDRRRLARRSLHGVRARMPGRRTELADANGSAIVSSSRARAFSYEAAWALRYRARPRHHARGRAGDTVRRGGSRQGQSEAGDTGDAADAPDPRPTVGRAQACRAFEAGFTELEAAPAARERPPAPAPVQEPTSIEPETGVEGSPDGIEGGVAGGVGDGPAGESASSGPGVGPSGPLRLGSTVAPPKKIKDVRPVYPQAALATQARGTVILDVTIGTDGKVQDAKVIHSVPQLDLAALEAVRQWEYEPTRINGALVALIMTVVVNFAIQ